MRQLILDLVPAQPPTLENFAAGGNVEALTGLAGWLAAEAPDTCVLLWANPRRQVAPAGRERVRFTPMPDRSGARRTARQRHLRCRRQRRGARCRRPDRTLQCFNRLRRRGRLLAAARVPPLATGAARGSAHPTRLRPDFSPAPAIRRGEAAALAAQARERAACRWRRKRSTTCWPARRATCARLAAILAALDRYSSNRNAR